MTQHIDPELLSGFYVTIFDSDSKVSDLKDFTANSARKLLESKQFEGQQKFKFENQKFVKSYNKNLKNL